MEGIGCSGLVRFYEFIFDRSEIQLAELSTVRSPEPIKNFSLTSQATSRPSELLFSTSVYLRLLLSTNIHIHAALLLIDSLNSINPNGFWPPSGSVGYSLLHSLLCRGFLVDYNTPHQPLPNSLPSFFIIIKFLYAVLY